MTTIVKMPKGTIGPQFVKRVIPWVEVFWHANKRYPTDTELSARFGFNADDLVRLRASKFYNECLKRRGISQVETFFTDKQVAAISLITNFADSRPVDAKLAGIGVTAEMYNGWMQNAAFKRELQSRADDILDNVYPEAQAALAKNVRNGRMDALKFYYEITGRANSPEAINLKMTMARMVEAVQKHVKDPAVLAAIAEELHGVAPVAEVPNRPIPAIATPIAREAKSIKELYAENRETYDSGD